MTGTQVQPQQSPGANTAPAQARAIQQRIADELGVRPGQVAAAVDLLDGGATVPFVARYRKEATGSLDDAQLRTLEERLRYLRELEERRAVVLDSIRSQGKLDDALEARILAADSKARLEDIYLPYKPKRRTKALIARENGLEPLADALLADPTLDPTATAAGYVTENVPDAAAALDGARAILVERFSEDADLIGGLRERMWNRGRLVSTVRAGKETEGAKFADYFDFSEPFTTLPSHRILAVFRGEKEEVLDVTLDPGDGSDPEEPVTDYERSVAAAAGIRDEGRAADKWLAQVVRWTWRTRILLGLQVDLRMRLRTVAEEAAIAVFAANLRDLLLAAPAGTRATMGLDPGLRTGVKVAVVDATGKVVATDTIYPHEPRRDWNGALATLTRLAVAHDVDLIAIGNGTASRETDKLAGELVAANPGLKMTKVDGQRGRGVGVLRVGLRVGRAAGPRRLAARRRVDRPPPAGPARGARQDRPEVHRRGPVPARPARVVAVALAGRGGRGRRERRRRGRQHRLGPAPAPRLRDHRGPRDADRGAPRRARPVPGADGAQRRTAAGPEGVRAVRGLPAHPRRRRPARRLRRAPRGLPGGAPDRREGGRRRRDAARQRPEAAVAHSRSSSSTTGSGSRP